MIEEAFTFVPIQENPAYRMKGIKYHEDPEFKTFTFSDYPQKPRASALRKLASGDYLFFHASLFKKNDNSYLRYIIGYFLIKEVLNSSNFTKEEMKTLYPNNDGAKGFKKVYLIWGNLMDSAFELHHASLF